MKPVWCVPIPMTACFHLYIYDIRWPKACERVRHVPENSPHSRDMASTIALKLATSGIEKT